MKIQIVYIFIEFMQKMSNIIREVNMLADSLLLDYYSVIKKDSESSSFWIFDKDIEVNITTRSHRL